MTKGQVAVPCHPRPRAHCRQQAATARAGVYHLRLHSHDDAGSSSSFYGREGESGGV